MTLAVCSVVTALAVTIKDPLDAPAGIVKAAGTVNAGALLSRPTEMPPAGAAALRDTVQLSLPAPVMLALLQESPLNTPGAASPVPLRLTVPFHSPATLVAMLRVPVAAPLVVGSNFTCSLTA